MGIICGDAVVRRVVEKNGYIGDITSTKAFADYYSACAYAEEMNDRFNKFYFEPVYITRRGEVLYGSY